MLPAARDFEGRVKPIPALDGRGFRQSVLRTIRAGKRQEDKQAKEFHRDRGDQFALSGLIGKDLEGGVPSVAMRNRRSFASCKLALRRIA